MSSFIKTAVSLPLLFSFVFFSVATNSFAQEEDMDQFVSESKNDLLVVISGGLAGAILGLSTLSFVDEPKEHTKNILVGASIGIIAGVGFVAFSQANKSREMLYGPQGSFESRPKFETHARSNWHQEKFQERSNPIVAPLSFGYAFNY